jgi:glycerol-3-phosphate O-acyltransferase
MLAPHYALTRKELKSAIENMARLCALLREADPELGDFTPALRAFLAGQDSLLEELLRGGIIKSHAQLREIVYFIPGTRRFTADFYRNACMHLLFAPALLALLELKYGSINISAVSDLYAFFKYDQILPDEAAFKAQLENLVGVLSRAAIIAVQDGQARFAKRSLGFFNPSLLQAQIQSALWVYQNLAALGANSSEGDLSQKNLLEMQSVNYAELLARLQNDFRAAMYLGRMSRTEAASNAALVAQLEGLNTREIISFKESGAGTREVLVKNWPQAEIALLQDLNATIFAWQHAAVA